MREYLATLLARPDEILLIQGAGGELLVARIRALLSALVLVLPLANAVGGAKVSETLIGLGAAVLTNIVAQVWLALAHNPRRHRWLPYATVTWDVSATTGVLVLLAIGDRAAGLNSMVVWAFYLIAIALTALRHDGRLTVYATVLALVESGMLAWVVIGTAEPEQLVSVDYGIASAATQVERLVLLLLMGLLTLAIVQRMQRLVEMSGRDVLTGLPNRLWLLQRMPAIFEDVREEGGSLCLALLDIDHFRRINDDIGHRDGDRALRHFSMLLGETLAQSERMVRIGGQEFVLLLRVPLGNAWERVDRLRRALGDRPFVPEFGGDPQRISFSAGLAAWPQDGADLSALLHSADRRLRQSKRDGGNRVVARDF
jgi:diguanylate cyclase (GGDEF)-like protein